MAVVVKRQGKLEKEIVIGGIVLIAGYFIWKSLQETRIGTIQTRQGEKGTTPDNPISFEDTDAYKSKSNNG